ncbi:hypothetical protein [Glaciihabitans sp. dw_435]|uniref:hypothetical protein n=1 Tax=Glaciihabitans sp. dw_435 TaxID=2720081 RepID=UPI001BD5F0A2|nr:hypothetical protein [Glaciihabitans sp. dw_435]
MSDNTPRERDVDPTATAGSALDAGSELDTDTEFDPSDSGTPARRGIRSGWFSSLIAVLFGIVYAYYLWDAIRSMVELPKNYTDLGLTTADVPWWLLIVGVAVPPVVYLLAFLIGRRHGVATKALVFFAGLATVAALGLAVIAVGSRVLTTLLGPAGGL